MKDDLKYLMYLRSVPPSENHSYPDAILQSTEVNYLSLVIDEVQQGPNILYVEIINEILPFNKILVMSSAFYQVFQAIKFFTQNHSSIVFNKPKNWSQAGSIHLQ